MSISFLSNLSFFPFLSPPKDLSISMPSTVVKRPMNYEDLVNYDWSKESTKASGGAPKVTSSSSSSGEGSMGAAIGGDKSGWLNRLAGLSWKKQYLVLRNGNLYVYKTPNVMGKNSICD